MQASAPKLINGYEPKWWKEAVVYQIYPRSFQDSNERWDWRSEGDHVAA